MGRRHRINVARSERSAPTCVPAFSSLVFEYQNEGSLRCPFWRFCESDGGWWRRAQPCADGCDNHAFVHVSARSDEQSRAFLDHRDGIGRGGTGAVSHNRAGVTGTKLAHPRFIALEHRVQHAGAARLREELGTEANQTTGRNDVVQADPSGAVVDHVEHPTPG